MWQKQFVLFEYVNDERNILSNRENIQFAVDFLQLEGKMFIINDTCGFCHF